MAGASASSINAPAPFNFLEFPTDIVFQVVLCRLRFKLSLRDLPELFLLLGFTFTHEAVREWEERFAPLLAEQLRRKRKGQVSRKWYVDETYLKVKGNWCYLYRAIDQGGNLVDSLLSEKRDMATAQRFFRSAQSMVSRAPKQVTTDGHDSYPRAIREVLGSKVEHRNNWFLNRHIERDHRSVKQRYYPMLGFSAFPSAQRFWRAFEEVRQYLRPRQKQNEFISLAQRRTQFITRVKVRSPNLNAYAERFVRTIKESCLDRMILFGEDALRKCIQEFTAHYHFERHHQGLGNRVILRDSTHVESSGEIRRRERLGGMLNYYYRDAA